jgi:proline dehydrogenase
MKLTQLGLAFDKEACIAHLRSLLEEAKGAGVTVEIDMEQSAYVSETIEIYRSVHDDFPSTRLAIQAYLRRTAVDLETLAPLRPKVRLVKGAYAEDESIALQKKTEIDAQYRFLTEWLFSKGTDPGIATHDSSLIEHAKRAAASSGAGPGGFEIQMLYGIRRELQEQLAKEGYRVRVYVPFGSAWYPYLMRRMAERPANLRFFARAVVGN